MPDDIAERLAPLGAFTVLRRMEGGHRNAVFLVEDAAGRPFVAKTTRRSEAALAWAARLQAEAARAGLVVPVWRTAPDGRLAPGGVTVETFAEGRPAVPGDLAHLRRPFALLRAATMGWQQRPGFASAASLLSETAGGDIDLTAMPPDVTAACRNAWAPLKGRRQTAVHGDLSLGNLLIAADRRPILLDWDECRRDSPLFDAASTGAATPAMARALLAWEVASGWLTEPERARRLARQLMG